MALRGLHREDRVPLGCAALYALALVASGIAPQSRPTWLYENLCPVIIIGLAVLTYRRFRFSNRAYVQGLALLLLHTAATYYTYPLVPPGAWVRDALELSRNHYDRFVHFAYGALVFLPVRELAFRREPRKHLATELFLTMAALMWFATGYEVLEWWGALVARKPSSDALLGLQGDVWDVQWDLLLAIVGATLAALLEASRVRARRSAREPQPPWRSGVGV